MSTFFHHPSNIITIEDKNTKIIVSLEEFLMFEPQYSLEAPAISRHYEQKIKHILSDGKNQYSGELPWKEGDKYISKLTTYIDLHNKHPDILNQAKLNKQFEIDHMAFTKKLGGIKLFNTIMPSEPINANQLISFMNAGETPKDFYLKDKKGERINATLIRLHQLNNAIVNLHGLCDLNADSLKDQLNKLNILKEIESFDINSNWPVIPFTL